MDTSSLPIDADDFYETLVENAAEGMLTIDRESRIVYANPAIEEILGYTPEELVGSSKMKIIPERLRPVHAAALASYVERGERNVDWDGIELPALHKDGHEVPTLISLREHEHGGERYFTGIIRDVTERNRRENELRRQKERLDEFADILAHDIRNPLSVARGYTDIAREDHEVPALEQVSNALSRIDTLVDDVLELSREGQFIGETEPADVADCSRDAWRNARTDRAELQVDADVGTILADESRFEELLGNLFRNAVEHGSTSNRTRSGDGEERGSTARWTNADEAREHGSTDDHPSDDGSGRDGGVTVRVGRLPDGDGLYVADDGPGIAESLREEVFARGYSTRKDGTGYGLSIVRQIGRAHGWDVSVTESERGGAQFEIRGVEFVGE